MSKKLNKSQLKKVRHIIESKVYQGSLSFTKKEGLTPKDKRFNKYARQLLKRGFDDSETWDLGTAMAEWLIPRLKRFKKLNVGYPGRFAKYKDGYEKWCKIIDEILWMLEERVTEKEETDLFNQYYLIPSAKRPSSLGEWDEWKKYEKRLNKAKKLFGEMWPHFWW